MFGIHVAKSSHILDNKRAAPSMSAAIIRDVSACRPILDMRCAQVFTVGPRSATLASIDYAACAAQNIFLIVHAAYVLAGIWRVRPDNAHTQWAKKQINLLITHLKTCNRLKSNMLVLHLPRNYPDEILETMKIIAPIAARHKVILALEMRASKSHADRTYETPEKIDNLTKILNDKFKGKWCWALDTAHIWSTGTDLRGNKCGQFLADLAYRHAIGLIHLNGSSSARGAGSDRHEIAKGPHDKIFNSTSLAAIIKFAIANKIPIICEVNRGTQAEFVKLIREIKRLTL